MQRMKHYKKVDTFLIKEQLTRKLTRKVTDRCCCRYNRGCSMISININVDLQFVLCVLRLCIKAVCNFMDKSS